jgi:hypothetical protein
MLRVRLGKAGRRIDHPATVDYLREQAPYSEYNACFSLSLFKFVHELPLQLRID